MHTPIHSPPRHCSPAAGSCKYPTATQQRSFRYQPPQHPSTTMFPAVTTMRGTPHATHPGCILVLNHLVLLCLLLLPLILQCPQTTSTCARRSARSWQQPGEPRGWTHSCGCWPSARGSCCCSWRRSGRPQHARSGQGASGRCVAGKAGGTCGSQSVAEHHTAIAQLPSGDRTRESER
jgi:hypothetical protein